MEGDKMKLPEFWRKWSATIVFGIAGEILGFLHTWLTLNQPLDRSLGAGLLYAILCATLGHCLKFIPEIRGKIEKTFDERMSQIIEFAALGTENGYFEEHLKKLRKNDLGNLRWVVAKFISYKLNKDFSNFKQIEIPNVSALDYSKLLASLIKECSQSIYFTCPYTPTEWFVKLEIDPCKDECKNKEFCADKCCPYSKQWCTKHGIKKEHLPEHIKAFLGSPVPDKKRVINIPRNKLQKICRNSECLKNFLNCEENSKPKNIEQDYKIKVRFVAQEDLSFIDQKYRQGDYNILDKQLVIKWENSKCILIFDKKEIEQHLKIFENLNASIYKRVENLIDLERNGDPDINDKSM